VVLTLKHFLCVFVAVAPLSHSCYFTFLHFFVPGLSNAPFDNITYTIFTGCPGNIQEYLDRIIYAYVYFIFIDFEILPLNLLVKFYIIHYYLSRYYMFQIYRNII
ncbi:hypothetical protein ACJX0J_027952, partial [Zea mays]